MRSRVKTPVIVTTVIFALLAVGFLVAGALWSVRASKILNEGLTTTATITAITYVRDSDGDLHYTVWVDYTAEGRQCHSTIGYSSDMYDGETLTVYYMPDTPLDISTENDLRVVPIIFLSLGGGFAVVVVVIVCVRIKKKAKIERLIAYNRTVKAKVMAINVNFNVSVNNCHPVYVECQYAENEGDVPQYFRSENLWFDPTPFIVGGCVTVYLDPYDSNSYYVDLGQNPITPPDTGEQL